MDFQVTKASETVGWVASAFLGRVPRGEKEKHQPLSFAATWLPRLALFLLLLSSLLLLPGALRTLSVILSDVSSGELPSLFSGQIPYKVVLSQELRLAEEAYQAALQRRLDSLNGTLEADMEMNEANLRALMLVPTYPCPLAARLGAWGEGGKWVCLRHHNGTKPPVVVSIGSNGDTSFERDVWHTFGVPSHTFDFSLDEQTRQKVEALPFIKFYPKGLAGEEVIAPGSTTYLSLRNALKAVDATYVDIFKCDCEGCEIEVVKDMRKLYTRDTVPFGHILLETHYIQNTNEQMELLLGLEELGYRMFHSEPNPFWSAGYEIAFIHEKLVLPRVA